MVFLSYINSDFRTYLINQFVIRDAERTQFSGSLHLLLLMKFSSLEHNIFELVWGQLLTWMKQLDYIPYVGWWSFLWPRFFFRTAIAGAEICDSKAIATWQKWFKTANVSLPYGWSTELCFSYTSKGIQLQGWKFSDLKVLLNSQDILVVQLSHHDATWTPKKILFDTILFTGIVCCLMWQFLYFPGMESPKSEGRSQN